MNRINYDFREMERIISAIKQNPTASNLRSLQRELNRFWKDKECREVLYTKNTDKLFFGMCVIPLITENDVREILTTDNKKVIHSYYLEIDSKLFELNLTTRELTAVLLHEVGHIVNNATPIDDIRKCMDTYCATNHEDPVSFSIGCRRILAFGIIQSLRVYKSIFSEKDANEFIADSFSVACGYGPDLESAIKKINNSRVTLSNQIDNKFIALQWSIRLYKELKFKRLYTIKSLNKLYTMSGSELEKKEIKKLSNTIKDMNNSGNDPIYESTFTNESFIDKLVDKASGVYRTFKYKGMRGLEDDLYEYNVRVENVDEEDESLSILRSINIRISMIDDYIIEERKHLSTEDIRRWQELKNKYLVLRNKLANKKTYKDKYYGLFVKTPVISSRYEA